MRPLRQKEPDAYYHVTSRTNNSELRLQDPAAKTLFLETVARAKSKYDFQLINFCILGNHFHFLIRPGKDQDLSRIMQWILSRFARAFNQLHGLSNHFWGERFFSRILRSTEEYWKTIQYVDENPRAAGLVEEKKLWPFSGLYHALKGIWSVLEKPSEELARYWKSLSMQETMNSP